MSHTHTCAGQITHTHTHQQHWSASHSVIVTYQVLFSGVYVSRNMCKFFCCFIFSEIWTEGQHHKAKLNFPLQACFKLPTVYKMFCVIVPVYLSFCPGLKLANQSTYTNSSFKVACCLTLFNCLLCCLGYDCFKMWGSMWVICWYFSGSITTYSEDSSGNLQNKQLKQILCISLFSQKRPFLNSDDPLEL